jgi:hypothetical protein
MHTQDGTRHEDVLGEAGETASVANHGVVRMLTNDHPGHLVLVQLTGQAPDAVCTFEQDVVIDKGDLVPTVQARQQKSEVPFRA